MNRVLNNCFQTLNKLQLKHLPQVNEDEYIFSIKTRTQIIITHIIRLASQEKRKLKELELDDHNTGQASKIILLIRLIDDNQM